MRPSSISLSKEVLAYSRIVSLSWCKAVEGGEGARGRMGDVRSPHTACWHAGASVHVPHHARARAHVRVHVQCERDKCEVWACGGRCDGRRGDIGRARLVLEAVEHVHEAALDPQLELVRVRDLEPLDLLQVALRDGDHLAALLRLPAEAARVHAQDAEVLLAVLVLAAEDDVAKLGGTGISGSGRHALGARLVGACWRNGTTAGPGVRATPPPSGCRTCCASPSMVTEPPKRADKERAAALVASESAPRVEGAERREFSGPLPMAAKGTSPRKSVKKQVTAA